jgi:hypothetical protein
MLDSKSLVESRINEIERQRDALLQDPLIKKYVGAVEKYVQEHKNRDLTLHEQRTVSQCLRNAIDEAAMRSGKGGMLFEATTEDNVSFLGIQLPVIAALLPSLVLPEVGIVQALDRRVAAVFYFDVKAGTTKGAVTSGDTLLSSTTGHVESKAGRRYAIARVVDETIGTGDGVAAGTTLVNPGLINLENVKVETVVAGVRTTIATSTAAGVISGTGVSGTINAAGQYNISITAAAAASGVTVYLTYDYQYDQPVDAYNDRNGVPEIDFSISQSTLEAIDFPVRSRYSVGAALDMMKAHGIDLESEVVKYLGHEVKFTIDQVGLDLIDEAASGAGAATAPTAWDATLKNGEPWIWKKHEINDRFEEGNNNIFDKTKRAVANFIVCGNNVARVLKQLKPDFVPEPGLDKTPPTGPVKIGTLNGRVVIQNPFKATNTYTMGYKGDNYLMAGFIYSPYIPLFATPTLITSDLMVQKGFLSSAGFKVINAGMFTAGTISNLGVVG